MPASSRNVNVHHGSNAQRRRIRHQTARSISTEKRSETERRGSQSEDTEMANGTSAGNRFAALAHTDPAPGVNVERGLQTKRTDFTFRCERHSPTAAGTTMAFEARQPLSPQAEAKVLRLQPVALSSTRKQTDPVLTSSSVAEPRITAPLQDSGDPQAPPTPPHTPPMEAPPLFAQSSIHNPPPAVLTQNLFPEAIDVHSTNLLRALQPQTGTLQTLLLSSSPLIVNPPLQPPRKLIPPKSKVHLPPTMTTAPNPQTTAARTLLPASDPLAHTTTSAESRDSATAAETAPATSRKSPEAISKPAERIESKQAEASKADSSEVSKESSVDEMSDDGSDGEWELIE